MSVTIYHNPRCSKSRETLTIIREAGIEPQVVEYLKTPFTKPQLTQLLADLAITPREAMRTGDDLYKSLGLGEVSLSDEELIDAMVREPALVNRPIVVTARGTRLCRPPALVNELI